MRKVNKHWTANKRRGRLSFSFSLHRWENIFVINLEKNSPLVLFLTSLTWDVRKHKKHKDICRKIYSQIFIFLLIFNWECADIWQNVPHTFCKMKWGEILSRKSFSSINSSHLNITINDTRHANVMEFSFWMNLREEIFITIKSVPFFPVSCCRRIFHSSRWYLS